MRKSPHMAFFVSSILCLSHSDTVFQLVRDMHTRDERTLSFTTCLVTSLANHAKYHSLSPQQKHSTNQLQYQASKPMLSPKICLLFVIASTLLITKGEAAHAKRLFGQRLRSIESAFWSRFTRALHVEMRSDKRISSMILHLHAAPQVIAHATQSAFEPVLATTTQTVHHPKHTRKNPGFAHLHNNVRPSDVQPEPDAPDKTQVAHHTHVNHIPATIHHHIRPDDDE
jgi:hypothetical protein